MHRVLRGTEGEAGEQQSKALRAGRLAEPAGLTAWRDSRETGAGVGWLAKDVTCLLPHRPSAEGGPEEGTSLGQSRKTLTGWWWWGGCLISELADNFEFGVHRTAPHVTL